MDKTIMSAGGAVITVLAAAGIAAGSFFDMETAQAVHSPDNIFWRIITVMGMYPYLAVWVFYMGVICRQARSSGMSEKKKTLWTVVCGYLGLSTSVICSWAMLSLDTLGWMFPQVIDNPSVIAAVALLVVYPMFFAGYFTSKKEYDNELLKRLVRLCVIMLIPVLMMSVLKLIFCRPRYRLLICEIPGIEFHRWYVPFVGSVSFINDMGVSWNDFRSFPSGHAVMSMGLVFALPPLAEIYDRLYGRKLLLFGAGAVFAILVCISRMVLGAHFLSDVCAGSLIAVLFLFVELRADKASRKKVTEQSKFI